MNTKNIGRRLFSYLLGLFIMTLGIAISVKSNLGVSPVSSVPYTMTLTLGIEMGKATIIFHAALVLLQILLLRKKFKWINLLQVVAGIIFGYFTTFCNSLMTFFPDPSNIVIRLLMMVVSAALIAAGIFFYVPADIMPLAGEGITQTVADIIHNDFSKCKVGFDVTMVTGSLIVCLIVIHSFGSVGIGTVIAAVLVGTIHGYITKFFGKYRDKFLKRESK